MNGEKPDQSEDLRRGFIAERRNLLLTSIVLVLVESAELRFPQINVLGNIAEMRDPNIIRALVWILWFTSVGDITSTMERCLIDR